MAMGRLAIVAISAVLAVPATAGAAAPTYVETFTSTVNPSDVEVAADGTVYASGSKGSSQTVVQRFTSTSTAVDLLTGTSGPGGNAFFPGIALDPSKAVYVVNNHPTPTHRMTKIIEGGTNVDNFGDGDAALHGPLDIERSPTDGRFYVSDETDNKVYVFDSSGTSVSNFNGSDGGETFQIPQGLFVAADGKVFVADRNSKYIKVFNHDGTFYGKFGGPSEIGKPRDVAVDGNTVYVTDNLNSKVLIYSLAGVLPALVDSFGGPGTAPGSFSSPTGIALGATGDVYVADSSARIQHFTYRPGTGGGGGGGNGGGGGGGTPTQGTILGRVRAQTGVNEMGQQTESDASGAKVEACLTDGRGCRRTTTDPNGRYAFTGAVNGTWTVRAFPPPQFVNTPSAPATVPVAGANATADLLLPGVGPPPKKTKIENESGARSTDDGVPLIDWTSPSTVTTRGCAVGGVDLKLFFQGRFINTIQMKGIPPVDSQGLVTYVAKIPPLFPAHGNAIIEFDKQCKKLPPVEARPASFTVYIDPSGTVTTLQGAPVVGATVTLTVQDPDTNVFSAPPNGDAIMSPANRKNPDTTRIDGGFGWDVLGGVYKVRVEKPGCHKPGDPTVPFIETDELVIPPAVTGLDLKMDCPDKVKPKLKGLKIAKRVLSVQVNEAATVKTLLQRCAGKRCSTVKRFSAKADFARTIDTKLPKSVKKGRYRVTATATDFAKNKAKPLVRTLRVK